MKYLINIIFIICSFSYGQFIPSLTQKQLRTNVVTPPVTPPSQTDNMANEDPYFTATLVTLAQKDSIQYFLDRDNSIRLEKGNYGRIGGTPINVSSNQSIYGHPEYTEFPNIVIEAGTTNTLIENVHTLYIDFEAGAPISNNEFTSIRYATLRSTGGQIENNVFKNIISGIDFDMSVSGYYRNNIVYRHQVQGPVALDLQGNNTTPSYGNIHLWNNYLTPSGSGAYIDNIEDMSFIGLDAEGWNFNETSTDAMFNVTNSGDIIMTNFTGGANYSSDPQPAWDIQANNLFLFSKSIGEDSPTENNIARTGTNVFTLRDRGTYDVEAGVTDFRAHTENQTATYDEHSVYINDVKQTTTITDNALITSLTNQVLRPALTPLDRPVHETLPNPTGANWATERVGQTDSTAYIQGLIDTNTIAELPEGIFYISSSLIVNGDLNVREGIIGQGTGKTAIVGLTDDFPLITVEKLNMLESSDTNIVLSNLTLQGGSKGIYFPTNVRLVAFNLWRYIIFRNQNKGIHFDNIFGFDNNFFDHLSFVDCVTAIHNEGTAPPPNPSPEYDIWVTNDLGYMDKTVFYRSQFINCQFALDLQSYRASNLNAWIDCKFEGNELIADLTGHNWAIFSNSDFTNNTGDATDEYLFTGSDASFYNCNFSSNTATYITSFQKLYAEGCNFLDTAMLCSDQIHFDQTQFLYNNTVNGLLGGGYVNNRGVYVNNNFALNPELNKLIVNEEDNVMTTIIDAPTNPYPQFLVKH